MFIGEKLLYLELPKTGCTHVRRLLRRLPSCEGENRGKHNTIYRLSEAERATLGSKIKFGNVRNPWDWYVSLWSFGCMGRGLVHRLLTSDRAERGRAGHSPRPWRESYRAGDVNGFRRWLRMLLETHREDVGLGFDRDLLVGELGFLTDRYLRLYLERFEPGDQGPRSTAELADYDRRYGILDWFVRTEFLEEDLLGVLAQVPIRPREVRRVWANRAKRRNASERNRDYRPYYDVATVDLVASRDAYLIAKHGYDFDNVVAGRPVEREGPASPHPPR